MRDWAEGEEVSEWGWGLREGGVTSELLLKKWEIRDLGLDYKGIYIYMGYFCNFRVPGFYLGRVLDFL